jgi:hypothetical protein
MWVEPLTPVARVEDPYTFDVIVRDGDGEPVAGVRCAVNVDARCGAFGEMIITNDHGGPKQRLRALVLLVREALNHANDLGLLHVETRVPPRLLDFARRMAGVRGVDRVNDTRIAGELAQIRSRMLDRTRPDGTELDDGV